MPYIKDENGRRKELREGAVAQSAGELNFQIFTHVKYDEYNRETIINYVKNFVGDNPNYQRYNDMTGALICCWKEIKRRLGLEIDSLNSILESYEAEINAYEDIKIAENGDV